MWGRCAPQISIHALLAESDCFCLCHLPAPGNFYPRSPCGERLSSWTFSTFTNRISIHALLAESDQVSAGAVAHGEGISIHALLAESDNNGVLLLFGQPISIHALLAESDTSAIGFAVKTALFLSTLSLRRATADEFYVAALTNISIHALLAESDCIIMDKLTKPDGISIHALLAESDFAVAVNIKVMGNFYPRSPCGERPLCCRSQARPFSISIHALLAESDLRAEGPKKARYKFLSTLSLRRATHINSRTDNIKRFLSTLSLRRATNNIVVVVVAVLFLSTLSLRRATARRASRQQPAGISIHALLAESDHYTYRLPPAEAISIHALLAESDTQGVFNLFANPDFYPRSPCGERQMLYPSSPHCCDFYPRSPCGERRAANSSSGKSITISIHALLAESDPVDIRTFQTLKIFLSTLSLRRATYKRSK